MTSAIEPTPADSEEVLFAGRPAVLSNAGALLLSIVTVGLALLYFWLKSLGTFYRITSKRVVIEHGVLSKRMEQLDTYRINDFVVERPFLQRIMGTGNVVLHTLDTTNPKVEVRNIKTDVTVLYERLRKASETERARRGVRVIE